MKIVRFPFDETPEVSEKTMATIKEKVKDALKESMLKNEDTAEEHLDAYTVNFLFSRKDFESHGEFTDKSFTEFYQWAMEHSRECEECRNWIEIGAETNRDMENDPDFDSAFSEVALSAFSQIKSEIAIDEKNSDVVNLDIYKKTKY